MVMPDYTLPTSRLVPPFGGLCFPSSGHFSRTRTKPPKRPTRPQRTGNGLTIFAQAKNRWSSSTGPNVITLCQTIRKRTQCYISSLITRMLSRMPCQGDDVPFTFLFPNEKTPPSASIRGFLPDPQHHSWNQTITHQAIGFGILNLKNLDPLLIRNFPDFHINSFASQ